MVVFGTGRVNMDRDAIEGSHDAPLPAPAPTTARATAKTAAQRVPRRSKSVARRLPRATNAVGVLDLRDAGVVRKDDAASDARRLESLDRKLDARLKELSEVHGI